MISSVIGRLRLVGFLEGLSYLLLLGIAMPLKYILGLPQAVQIIGMLHGVLFILFIALSVHATIFYKWSFGRLLFLWLASIIPFGTFYVDYRFLRKQAT